MEWLGDRVLTQFGRHKAPLLQSHKLAPDEQAFILMSLIPNRKGQPLLVEWQVACRKGDGAFALESFDAFMERAGTGTNLCGSIARLARCMRFGTTARAVSSPSHGIRHSSLYTGCPPMQRLAEPPL